MSLATIKFFMNQYHYPHYSETLTEYYEPERECTPVGMGLKGGTLHLAGTMTDFTHANYFLFKRDGEQFYAWIEDVTYKTANSFEITYSVDAWRTYKHQIELGYQYIARTPMGSTEHRPKKDPLLGGRDPYPIVESKEFSIGDNKKRVFVVQVRTKSGELFSRTPVNPTPYNFYMVEYPVNQWMEAVPIDKLMTFLRSAETENIVTMYSIPYMDLSNLDEGRLPVITANETNHVDGFKILGYTDSPYELLSIKTPITFDFNLQDLFYGPHSVQIVVPEAGIINVPDELLDKPDLALQQDVDLFSGACNYMLVSGARKAYTQSIRGSSVASIPIVSDPLDTYLSQNQNALATSLMGDVAMIAGGGLMAAGLPGIGAAMGGASAMTGISNIVKRQVSLSEAANNFSNPAAFLGTALASRYNQQFWVVTTRAGIDNHDVVHANYGYVYDMIDRLIVPAKGFIQTEGCSVRSKPGWGVPKWAIAEVNDMFNQGLLVHE